MINDNSSTKPPKRTDKKPTEYTGANRLSETTRKEIDKALRAAERQRRAAAFNSKPTGREIKPAAMPIKENDRAHQSPFTQSVTLPENNSHGQNEYIKIWALVGLAAIRAKRSGGWRAWQLCRHLDKKGGSRISKTELWNYFDYLGIGNRKRRGWIKQALRAGLLRFYPALNHFYMVSLGNAAIILDCKIVGLPAEIRVDTFVKTGWRAIVWSAYLATTNGRLISQATKAKLTGVKPRTQREFQAQSPGIARHNYVKTNIPNDHIQGLRDNGQPNVVAGNDGRVYSRLPDIRIVPVHIARTLRKGRSRKAQKLVNLLFSGEQEQGGVFKLFHESDKGANGALRKIERSDLPYWKLPKEVFKKTFSGNQSNIWEAVPVESVQSINNILM